MVRVASPCKGGPCLQRPILGLHETVPSLKQHLYCAASLHSSLHVVSAANIGRLLALRQQRTQHVLNIN